MKLSAYIGVTYRTRIDELARDWNMTLAQAVRRLVVLGLGGDDTAAMLVNEEAAGRRQEAIEKAMSEHPDLVIGGPSPRALASDGSRPRSIVTVRMPKPWPTAIKRAGGFKACVLRGLEAVGEGE